MMMSRIRSSRLTPSSVKPVTPARDAASTADSMVPLTNRRIATSKLPITMSSRAGASTANWTAAAPRRVTDQTAEQGHPHGGSLRDSQVAELDADGAKDRPQRGIVGRVKVEFRTRGAVAVQSLG